jgi:excisionase family DNA binding protein
VTKAHNKLAFQPETPGDLGVKWYTTGQIAKRLSVSPTTVSKWIDSGRLIGIRLPGSKDRRVHPKALEEFEQRTGFAFARGAGRSKGG